MNKWFTYENFWTRNVLFGVSLFGLIYIRTKLLDFPPHPPEFPDTLSMFGIFLYVYCSVSAYNHFVVRNLLFKKRYAAYTLATTFVLLTHALIITALGSFRGIRANYASELFPSFFILFIGTAVYFIHTWIIENVVRTKKQLLDKESELFFLKQQISPHFLFNALNNLYGVALAYPAIIADKILELSDLLRYQVESTKKDAVSIEEEMSFVESYINYTNFKSKELHISNKVIGTVDGFCVPPLLFLPLIENAIKYSAETENSFINIMWSFQNNELQFDIENSYNPLNSEIKGTKVGIENLKKRLQVLNVKHTLTSCTDTPNVYKIQLKLWELAINV
ncbi:MAG: histidine kinase [Candidatus Kapabacteria bacterium]|nr:histidine kinase [Candidatus Kapabacteria bacterium]